MLGFSLPKLLVLAAIVLAIWYGFKWVGRLDRERKAALKAKRREEKEGAPKARRVAQDMVKCPVCATFVQADGATACERADCPYPA